MFCHDVWVGRKYRPTRSGNPATPLLFDIVGMTMTQEVVNTSHVADLQPTQPVVAKRQTETTVIDQDHVFVRFTFKMNADSESCQKATMLDFSDVSREQLLELCCGQGLVVRMQRMLRDLNNVKVAADPKTLAEVVVLKDIIGATRTRLPSDESAIKTLSRKLRIDENELRSVLHSLSPKDDSDQDVTVSS